MLLKNISWSLISNVSCKVISFLTMLYIANQLGPETFAVLAVLSLFMALSEVLSQSGFYSALIRKVRVKESDYNTVFFSNLVFSILLYGAFCASSDLVSDYFSNDIYSELIPTYGLLVVLNSIVIVPNVILVKNDDFKLIMCSTLISVIISSFIGVYLTYQGHGVWALVYMRLSQSFLNLTLSILQSRWLPSGFPKKENLTSLYDYSKNLLLSSLINNFFNNINNLLIAKFFSIDKLAFYNMANSIVSTPVNTALLATQKALYPSMCKNSTKDGYFSIILFFKIYLVIGFLIISIALPFSDILIEKYLSSDWAPVSELIKYFFFLYSTYPILGFFTNYNEMLGNSKLILKAESASKLILLFLLTIAVYFPIKSLVIALIFSQLVKISIFIYKSDFKSTYVLGFYYLALLFFFSIYEMFMCVFSSLDVYSFILSGFFSLTIVGFVVGLIDRKSLFEIRRIIYG